MGGTGEERRDEQYRYYGDFAMTRLRIKLVFRLYDRPMCSLFLLQHKLS